MTTILITRFSWGILLSLFFAVAAADEASLARSILKESGVQGGLVVHVGCGNGRLTAALYRSGENFLAQGLDRDAAQVEKARLSVRGERSLRARPR